MGDSPGKKQSAFIASLKLKQKLRNHSILKASLRELDPRSLNDRVV